MSCARELANGMLSTSPSLCLASSRAGSVAAYLFDLWRNAVLKLPIKYSQSSKTNNYAKRSDGEAANEKPYY